MRKSFIKQYQLLLHARHSRILYSISFLKMLFQSLLVDFATQFYIMNQCTIENRDKIFSPRK